MRATETAVRSDPDERMPQRGAYGVGLDTCCMVEVDPERFEVMVSEALDGIPGDLGELMSNVAVTVQHDSGPAGLVGLYQGVPSVSYTHLRAHETVLDLVCRLLLEKKKQKENTTKT